jgi:D-alanyl-D-alanine carboxypeptidase/D-alanyl-D-alanine-endopeptidase (penicillin-binding protein 4)
VAAYYRLALAADPRNLPFLRTALRTEDDPVARMAAAEAVYLSDPYGDAARRVFLEAVPPDPAALARLQALAGAAFSSPVVISLGDLAAEGVPEALLRLAELCAAGMAEELAPVWEEVAAVAPEETLALLRAAPAPLAEAALASLARGIARSAAEAGPSAPRHPCLAALEVAGHVEGPSGEEARALRIRLDERLAEALGAARDAAAGPTAIPANGAIGPAAGPASGPAPAPGGG